MCEKKMFILLQGVFFYQNLIPKPPPKIYICAKNISGLFAHILHAGIYMYAHTIYIYIYIYTHVYYTYIYTYMLEI